MSRRTQSLTLDRLGDLPEACRHCVFWELDPGSRRLAEEAGDPGLDKEAWISSVLLDWGACGKVLYVDEKPAGYALFAPPGYVPGAAAMPTGPVSGDAVLLMALHVDPAYARGGLGRMLVQSVAKELTQRGVKAIEAFGDARPSDQPRGRCVLPADFYLAVGFKTVRPHPHFPRLRLELKSLASWRDEMEAALEHLLETLAPESALRPA
jgi:GNAT superfamily N-acetyltransferase